MVGERLRLKRNANQMSLQDLVCALKASGVSITKAALSNYETGKTIPNDSMLQILAQELGTTTSFLTYQDKFQPEIVFFHHIDTFLKNLNELEAYVHVTLEKQLSINEILGIQSKWTRPETMRVTEANLDQVEAYALEVRRSWRLNEYPISSVTSLLEKQGWDVFEIPASFGLSGISGYDKKSNVPFVYCATKAGIVNLRMQLLQEAARAYFEADSDEVMEKAIRRFAATILFTREQALLEFGPSRKAITSAELTLMKKRYGLPKYEVMRRLQQVGIISMPLFRVYMGKIRQHGYPSNRDTMDEPLFFFENPSEYNRKVQYAYAEGLIEASENMEHQMMPDIYYL